MAGRGHQTFKKRQKEQKRKERQEEKLKRRFERKHESNPEANASDAALNETERPSSDAAMKDVA